jgi:hypothetical protein
MPNQQPTAAARLRLAAFSILAKHETGLSVAPTEAENWLARFPTSLGDALDAFSLDVVPRIQARAITPIRGSARVEADVEEGPVQLSRERSTALSLLGVRPGDAPIKQASAPKSASLVAVSVLSLTSVWSFLIAAIAAQSTLLRAGDLPGAALLLLFAGLGVALGVRSASLLGAEAAIVAPGHRSRLQLLFALLGLVVFLIARFIEQRLGAIWLETLIQPSSLSIWLGLTLTAFLLLRRRGASS